MSCAGGITRIIVALINTVFLLFGAAVLIIGIVFKTSWDEFKDAFEKDNDTTLGEDGETLGVVCIAFGAVMLLIALLGLIGACCNVKWALGAYGALTLLLLIGQIVAVAVVATNFGDVKDGLKDGLKKAQKDFEEDLSDASSESWAKIFHDWECCGVDGPMGADEFQGLQESNDRTDAQKQIPAAKKFPIACCSQKYNYEETTLDKAFFQKTEIDQCLKGVKGFYYADGCEQKVEDFFEDNKTKVIGVGCAIFAIELLIVIMAFWLCSRHSDNEYEQK